MATALRAPGVLDTIEVRVKGPKAIPWNAADTLAEGEFNRFYARGVARRACEEEHGQVVVYRAKQVAKPRADSERRIGAHVDAEALLADLRASVGMEPALGLPPGPSSALSVRLP